MFSDNNKISKRQLNKMLILELFGVTSLLLPSQLANLAGRDGILSILIGTVLALLYIVLVFMVIQRIEEDIFEDFKKKCGKLAGFLIGLIFYVQLLLVSAFALELLGEVVISTLMAGGSRQMVILTLLFLCGYAASGGIENRARMEEVLFYIILLPLLFMLLFSLREVDVENLFPLRTENTGNIAMGGYFTFAVYSVTPMLLLLTPYFGLTSKEQIGKMKKTSMNAILFLSILNGLLFIILLGAFGVEGVKVQNWPIITLMTVIKAPGGFLERLDVLMIGVWLLSIFSLINACFSYEKLIMRKVIKKENPWLFSGISLALTYGATLFFNNFEQIYELYKKYLLYFVAPGALLIPILFILAYEIRKVMEGRKQKDEI